MSNHGYVKTRKLMKPGLVTQTLNDLNLSHFQNHLLIEFNDLICPAWSVDYQAHNQVWAYRCFWLNTSRSLEINHGGNGGCFGAWIDAVIRNEIAVRFCGFITDDGDSDCDPGIIGQYDIFPEYLKLFHEHYPEDLRQELTTLMLKSVPSEFQQVKVSS